MIGGMIKAVDNVGYGVDTIKASVALPSRLTLNADGFDVISTHETKQGLITKWIIKPPSGETSPRITFYPSGYRLLCEVSLPKFLVGDNVTGLSSQICEAFELLNERLSELSSQPLPKIQTWSIRRIDYVTGWYVNNDMLSYLQAIGTRELPRYEKNFFARGVRWQTKSRRINIYDKFAQDRTGLGLLRCEIQNRWSAIAWMAKKWFGLAPTVENFTTETMARVVLIHYLEQLRVKSLPPVPDDLRLQSVFASRWAQAKTYRELIDQYGRDAYKTGLMSRASYYRYKSELIEHNLLGDSEYQLPELEL
jgi:hypothetical protein